MINTDCSTCPFADKCYMKDKFQSRQLGRRKDSELPNLQAAPV